MMDENVYLVIMHYSYETDMPIKVFKTEEEAKKFLENEFEDEVDFLIKECGVPEENIETKKSDDGLCAILTNKPIFELGETEVTDWTIVEMKQRELIPQSYEGKE